MFVDDGGRRAAVRSRLEAVPVPAGGETPAGSSAASLGLRAIRIAPGLAGGGLVGCRGSGLGPVAGWRASRLRLGASAVASRVSMPAGAPGSLKAGTGGSLTGGDSAGTRATCGASAAGASPCDALPSTIFAPRPRSSTPRPPGFSRCHTSHRNFMSSGRSGGGGSGGARSRRGAPGACVAPGSDDDDDDSGNAENDPLERSTRCLGEKPSLTEAFAPVEVGPATSGSFSDADSTRSAPPTSTADGNGGAKSRATLTARARAATRPRRRRRHLRRHPSRRGNSIGHANGRRNLRRNAGQARDRRKPLGRPRHGDPLVETRHPLGGVRIGHIRRQMLDVPRQPQRPAHQRTQPRHAVPQSARRRQRITRTARRRGARHAQPNARTARVRPSGHSAHPPDVSSDPTDNDSASARKR